MKTKIITLIAFSFFSWNICAAKIFRVGYQGTPLAGVDYTKFYEADAAASPGDTIQIYGDAGTNGGSVDKRLVILGFGYNLDVHSGLQAIGGDAPSSASINFIEGSDGSIVKGISGNFGIYSVSGTPISNITIERCIGGIGITNYIGYGAISNIKILSSVISLSFSHNAPNSRPVINLQIYNCILSSSLRMYDPGTTAYVVNCVAPAGVGDFFNFNDANVLVKNCIIHNHDYYGNQINTIYENNIFGESQPTTLPPGSNNQWGQNWGDIFNRLGGTADEPGFIQYNSFDENYYILKSGSPAINAGLNAASQPTNCGIFGGEAGYVYKSSGIPPIPAIYQLTAPGPAVTSNPYNITISVRGNN